MKKLQPGVNLGFSNAEYHADKSYHSSSQLKLINDDPSEFERQILKGEREQLEGSYLDIGSFVHTLLLEPHMLDQEYAIAHECFQRRGKSWTAFVEKHEGSGKVLLSASMAEQGRAYAASVKACPPALELLAHAKKQNELSICRIIDGVPCKVRWDNGVAGEFMLDIKTTAKPSGIDYFRETIYEYEYDFSAAMYKRVADEHYAEVLQRPVDHVYYWLVISKEDHQADLYRAKQSTLAGGLKKFNESISTYKQCKASGIWAAPPKAVKSNDYVIQEV